MGNPIGSGTRNIAVNVPVDERDFWGRMAAELNARSIGELHRHLLLKAVEQTHPDKAAELKEIRRRYYGSVLALLLCASMICGGGYMAARRVTVPRPSAQRSVRNRSVAGRQFEVELIA